MMLVCQVCPNTFKAPTPSKIAKGYGKFCSLKCSAVGHLKTKLELGLMQPDLVVVCLCCDIRIVRPANRAARSKSGFYFCSKACKDLAFRLDGAKETHPTHFGTGVEDYRAIALRAYPHCCNRCGYDRHLAVLHVHHKDKNHGNNNVENLEILCPTCHIEHHYLERVAIAVL